jgi:3-methyladenine DNA glycosylase AlkD
MTATELIEALQSHANPANVAGMARFGINPTNTLGVPVVTIRKLAKAAGRNHDLAIALWDTGIHEARILATIVDVPAQVTRRQMDEWARDFDSWDICDQACMNLFCYTPHVWDMIAKWSRAKPEFVRRAGFALLASAARKAKDRTDERLESLLPLIVEAATDDRNFVKKAVNWALRTIGKCNPRLRKSAIATAEEIRKIDSKAARWIAADALRELTVRS